MTNESPPASLSEFYRQEPVWSGSAADGIDYATIEVPLNYADPGGERLSIAISRKKATDPARRRGILLTLNGGPGGYFGLGTRFPATLAKTRLTERYDVIGFDPRGTGASTPLLAEITATQAKPDSRPPESRFATIAEDARAREQGCIRAGGQRRLHFSTRNLVRDMDVIRAALGEDKLNYLGYTYGTYAGAVYGSMFPDRLDRNVLDSCVHPDWSWREQLMAQGPANRANLEKWAEWVAGRSGHFSLGDSAEAVLATVEEAVAALGAQPENTGLRTLLDCALGSRSADRARWTELGLLVADLRTGDRALAEKWLADERIWPPSETEGETRCGVLDAVIMEKPWPSDLETYFADMREYREKYPYANGVMRAQPFSGAPSSFTPPESPVELRREGYPAGLVVHADGDPIDHYPGGAALAKRLGHRLITIEDSGQHEIYAFRGNAAVDELVEKYLLDGELPAADTVCASTVPRPNVPAGT
ncbi:alpha/beta hydrolase [Crossiella sp. SN42]|uniref:alpha/beta fold hydrolase n=1 Tax=Crossiella sp. SN42 TaxID=2944808 RepID=UPI00207C4815|nr:alpha/beta fold hydrolase [Crossiella sp. SN42]MCO1576042.1 alpha/beta hydrolase [Crossiella sp. SN42]